MKRYTLYIIVTLATLLPQPLLAQQREFLSLERCLELGNANSLQVRNSALDVKAAAYQKDEALCEYFPTLKFNAFAFHSLNPMLDLGVRDILGNSDMAYQIEERVEQMAAPYGVNTRYRALEHGFSTALALTQPVVAGGRIINGNKLAALGVEAARHQLNISRRNSSEQIQKAYFQILALQQKEQTLRSAQKLLDSLHRDVSAAVKAGIAMDTDLVAVELKMAELKAGASKLRLGLRIAKMNLLNTIGVDYNPYTGVPSDKTPLDSFVFEGDFGNMKSPSEAYVDEEALAAAQDESSLLQLQVEAKTLQRRMTLGETLPSLAIGASYGYSRFVGSARPNGTLFAVFQLPITDWGKNSRKLERQRVEIEKAVNDRDFYRNQLVLQMRQLYMELLCSYDNMDIARQTMELASRRFDRMGISYRSGMCTVSELLQCETEKRNSEEAYFDACVEYLESLMRYELRSSK